MNEKLVKVLRVLNFIVVVFGSLVVCLGWLHSGVLINSLLVLGGLVWYDVGLELWRRHGMKQESKPMFIIASSAIGGTSVAGLFNDYLAIAALVLNGTIALLAIFSCLVGVVLYWDQRRATKRFVEEQLRRPVMEAIKECKAKLP